MRPAAERRVGWGSWPRPERMRATRRVSVSRSRRSDAAGRSGRGIGG